MDTKGYNNQKILVFAGTSEGRRLAEAFAERKWQHLADFCVATEYGTEMLPDSLPQGVITVSSAKEAAALVHQREDKVLLTTGAKELFQYSGVRDIADRIVARVLPSVASIEACLGAGIASKHIVAMQGPFTKEMNLATMKQYGCTCLVTKHTGKPGGFDDKLAVLEAGYTVIVIEKPAEETGVSFETVMRKAERFYEQ